MEARRKLIDRAFVERMNGEHKDRIRYYKKWVERVTADANRSQRLKAQECIICYGGSRIGGAACTRWTCAFCGKSGFGGNTNVDVLCIDCAKAAGLCKHCGADIDLKNRRKRTWPTVAEVGEVNHLRNLGGE